METILQSEAAECGLSSLAMVASHHGFHADLNQLRHQFPQSLRGTTLKQLTEIAHAIGFSSRALKLELEEIQQLNTPCILHWQMNHFVVLTHVSKTKVRLVDPARGEITMSFAELSQSFTGVALEIAPAEHFHPKPKSANGFTLKAIFNNAKGLSTPLMQLLVLSLFLQLIVLATPYYLQITVDSVLPSFDGQFLVVLAIGFAGLSIFNAIVTALRGATIVYFNHSLSQQLAFSLFNRVLRLPITFFEKRFIGDIVSRFGSLEPVRQIITNHLVEGAVDGLMAITTLVMIYLYSPTLSVVVLVTMLIYLLIRIGSFQRLKTAMEHAIHHRAKESSNFMENIRAIQTIRLFGLEDQRQNLWQNQYIKSLNCEIHVARLQLVYQVSNGLLFGLENVIVIYLGASMVLLPTEDQAFTLGMLTAFIAYKTQLTQRFVSLIDKFIELKTLRLHLDRLSDFLAEEPESRALTHHSAKLAGQLTIRDVSFAFSEHEPQIFRRLNLSVAQGESVAIIGASGCGKTTLLKLLLGFITPTEGHVNWAPCRPNEPIDHVIRKQIGTVMQNDQLLAGSIADNIAQFSDVYELEKVIQCAKVAAIHDEIIAMPMGYQTLIGEMGTTLSGGQIQRVILARALFHEPKILLLDEASAHLDVQSEYLINQALNTLNMTKIVVAHRPETITQCQTIYEMSNGALTEVTAQFRKLSPPRVNIDSPLPCK